MNKENIIVISLFIFLSLVGYGVGYFISSFLNTNQTIKDAVHFLLIFAIITTFYSILKIKVFKYFKIEEKNEN
ncbi:MAG: hypothetical protein GX118_04865 [Arcobacter butzleri]|jgi:hypothetical protein|nr:hypothetical protein [Arcobacteraceae bacterium]NLO17503.1 hypothetical protein [Aliarcobacter butzleri]